MKKNLLTILILALGVLNMILTAVIVFAVVPTTMRTNALISKVASTIELELEGANSEDTDKINIADIENYNIEEKMTINLKNSPNDSKSHYASVTVSLSVNKKAEDYSKLSESIASNENAIKEIVRDEFINYTKEEVTNNDYKEKIKSNILLKIQEYFDSDFIVGISTGILAD
ncbi:MAG: flagellar basal body-associated FliL family protein [Anaerocolumna sp.]